MKSKFITALIFTAITALQALAAAPALQYNYATTNKGAALDAAIQAAVGVGNGVVTNGQSGVTLTALTLNSNIVLLVHGSTETPYANAEVASAAAAAGDTIVLLGRGPFYVTNGIQCPPNGSVIGAGKFTTLIIGPMNTNSVPGFSYPFDGPPMFTRPAIIASCGGVVANLSISNVPPYFSPNGSAASPLGGCCIGSGTMANYVTGITNFSIVNCSLRGGADTLFFYVGPGTACDLRVSGSEMWTAWDGITFSTTYAAGAALTNTIHDCIFWKDSSVVGAVNAVGVTPYDIKVNGQARAVLNIEGTAFIHQIKQGGISSKFITLADMLASIYPPNVSFKGCRFEQAPGEDSGLQYLVRSGAPAGTLIRFENCFVPDNACALNPDNDPINYITLGTNISDKFSFGSDFARPLRPNLTSGAGAPTAVEPAGSVYLRSDGGTNSCLYVSNGDGTWMPQLNQLIGNGTGLTNLNASALRGALGILNTNVAPSSVTLGATAPDYWSSYTNTAGVRVFTPGWINH